MLLTVHTPEVFVWVVSPLPEPAIYVCFRSLKDTTLGDDNIPPPRGAGALWLAAIGAPEF